MGASMEHEVKDLKRRVGNLEKDYGQMHKDLVKLIGTLNNIKFWLYGVGSFYIINEAGLMPLLKKFLGV